MPEKQLGICIKISDGNERGVYPVTTHILSELGILNKHAMEELKVWAFPPVKNHKGKIVGYTIPVFNMRNKENNIRLGDKYEFKGE